MKLLSEINKTDFLLKEKLSFLIHVIFDAIILNFFLFEYWIDHVLIFMEFYHANFVSIGF